TVNLGLEQKLYLRSLEARRDWGYARAYVEAMWRMLQQDATDDYVIATGETHTVQEFLEEAFACAALDWREHVGIDARYYRPAEVDLLVGDAAKARRVLGWEARTRFREVVRRMFEADLELARAHAAAQASIGR